MREQRFVEHTLQIAIQAALDVASHIVSDRRLGEPRSDAPPGWTDFELKLLEAHGFRIAGAEPRTLRSDTACVALVALVHDAPGAR